MSGSKYLNVLAEMVVATARHGCFLGRGTDDEAFALATALAFLLSADGSDKCKHLRVPGKAWLTDSGNGAVASV